MVKFIEDKRIKQENVRAYDSYPALFEIKFGEYFERYGRKFVDNFSDLLPGGARVLSLGAGPGHAEKYMREKGYEVTCIDNSVEMAELCKQKGLSVRVMDMEKIDKKFEADSFGGVWAHTSLLHLRKKSAPEMIKKIASVLKKKGLFALVLMGGEKEEYDHHPDYPRTKRWFSYFSDEEIAEFCRPFFNPIYAEREEAEGKRRNYVFLKYILRKR
ncbi:MAG: class I SAM-dependent methyltransferase [Nanoarchaeota archaeon]